MTDALVCMFNELRRTRPPVFLADEFASWLASVGQVVAALPGFEQRWASCALIAYDLVGAMPGLGLPVAYRTVMQAVGEAETRIGR